LAAAGALSEPSRHRVGIAAGTTEFYRYLSDSDLVAFGDADLTHDVATLGAIDRFYAINAALQIDLMGQVNLEWQNWRLVGGVGGAPEFVRAGLLSRGGGSLTLIPSKSRDGKSSRIVTRLSASSVSMARNDIGTVVTENGVAELRNLSIDERAAALIAIASEEHQEELDRGWRRLRAMM
jgi:acyl-CoA hydrolase